MSPVSESKTGMAIFSSDVTGIHQSARNSIGNLIWAAFDGVTLRSFLSCYLVRRAMGCSDGWDWWRVWRPTGSWVASFLGGTLVEGAGTWS